MRMSGGTYDPAIYTSGLIAIPPPNPNYIKDRQADFTDLCVFYTLSYYLYPKIADFSQQDNAEKVKIGFMNEKYRSLFQELIDDGSWYDWSGNGTITPAEKLSIIKWIKAAENEPQLGGAALGRVGPVTEGLLVWTLGLGLLIGVAVWLATKAR
jgi:hypothetical protein